MTDGQTLILRFPKDYMVQEDDKAVWFDTKMTKEEFLMFALKMLSADDDQGVMFDPDAEEED